MVICVLLIKYLKKKKKKTVANVRATKITSIHLFVVQCCSKTCLVAALVVCTSNVKVNFMNTPEQQEAANQFNVMQIQLNLF